MLRDSTATKQSPSREPPPGERSLCARRPRPVLRLSACSAGLRSLPRSLKAELQRAEPNKDALRVTSKEGTADFADFADERDAAQDGQSRSSGTAPCLAPFPPALSYRAIRGQIHPLGEATARRPTRSSCRLEQCPGRRPQEELAAGLNPVYVLANVMLFSACDGLTA